MSSEKKQVWRFTFGSGQYKEGYCQPIFGTFASAWAKMVSMYGLKWCMQYSEKEWEDIKNDPDRDWEMEKDLKLVEA